MVKNEAIVTILEYFQLVFLLLFLLNGEIVFIFRDFKGKIFHMFGFVTASPLFLLLPVFAAEKRRKISNEDSEGRERGRKPEMFTSKEVIKWQIVAWR